MGFTLTLASGFNIVWFDSVGGIIPEERALADQLGANVDVAMFPYTPSHAYYDFLANQWFAQAAGSALA